MYEENPPAKSLNLRQKRFVSMKMLQCKTDKDHCNEHPVYVYGKLYINSNIIHLMKWIEYKLIHAVYFKSNFVSFYSDYIVFDKLSCVP